MKIQAGTYRAHLAQAERRVSSTGKPMIVFLWQLDDTDLSVKSYLPLKCSDGTPNLKGIGYARRWAPDWDGSDPDWFTQNIAFCSKYAVKLCVKLEPGFHDPINLYPKVTWIYPVDMPPSTPPVSPGVRPFDPDRVAQLPSDLEPSMNNVWRAFRLITDDWSEPEREAAWFDLLGRVQHGKDQIDFDVTDWANMLHEIKGEEQQF